MLATAFVSAFLALSAPAVLGQVYGWGRCPNVPVAHNFKEDRWLGTWMEIARFPNSVEGNMYCITETIERVEGGRISYRTNGIRDGLGADLDPLHLYAVENAEEPAKFSVPYFNHSFLPELPYWILEIDHDPQTGYYVGFTCYDFWVANMQYLWIVSKERQMDKVRLTDILGRPQGHGIDTNKLEYPKQDDTCPALS